MFLPKDYVKRAIAATKGKAFYVEFIKRGDGTLRKMVCRLGVKKYVRGVLPPGHRQDEDNLNDVITVFEFATDCHKRVPLDSVVRISAGAVRRSIDDVPEPEVSDGVPIAF